MNNNINWNNIPVDTPVLVRNYEKAQWLPRYFAKYYNKEIWVWKDGTTSKTCEMHYEKYTDANSKTWVSEGPTYEIWTYAKLA